MPTTLIRRTARLRDLGLGRGTRLIRRWWETVFLAGFEVDTESWTAGASTSVASSTNEAQTGTHSLRVAATAAAGFVTAQRNLSAPTQGDTYAFDVWIIGEGSAIGKQYIARVRENGGAQADANVASATFTMPADWTAIAMQGVIAQADRTSLAVQVFQNSTATGSEVYYLDDARLRRRP